jgi:hypothetical protein
MAGENLEIARLAFNELGGDDYADGMWDPGIEVINAEGWVIESSYHGHAGLRRWWEDLAEAFGDFRVELEEVLEVDGATEIPFDGPWASIVWIRDGKVVRAEGHLTKRRAMRAAGLT